MYFKHISRPFFKMVMFLNRCKYIDQIGSFAYKNSALFLVFIIHVVTTFQVNIYRVKETKLLNDAINLE